MVAKPAPVPKCQDAQGAPEAEPLNEKQGERYVPFLARPA